MGDHHIRVVAVYMSAIKSSGEITTATPLLLFRTAAKQWI